MGRRGGSLLTLFFLFWWQLFATFVVSSYNNYYHPYDMSSLAFMAIGLWMVASRQPLWALLALSVPATMNRESSGSALNTAPRPMCSSPSVVARCCCS